jgi:hypothetical protein
MLYTEDWRVGWMARLIVEFLVYMDYLTPF